MSGSKLRIPAHDLSAESVKWCLVCGVLPRARVQNGDAPYRLIQDRHGSPERGAIIKGAAGPIAQTDAHALSGGRWLMIAGAVLVMLGLSVVHAGQRHKTLGGTSGF
jgi:hypothetical protein